MTCTYLSSIDTSCRGRPNRGAWGVRREAVETVQETDGRPVWEVLQAINWLLYNPAMCKGPGGSGNSTPSTCHTPNASEVRSMTWQAIAAGANGIFYWEFNDLFRNPDVGFNTSFGYYSDVAQEVERLAPMLLSGNGPAPLPIATGTTAARPMAPPLDWLMMRAHYWPPPRRNPVEVVGAGSSRSVSRELASIFLLAVSDGSGGGTVTFDYSGELCPARARISVEVVMPGGEQQRVTINGACQFTAVLPSLDAQAFNVTFEAWGAQDG